MEFCWISILTTCCSNHSHIHQYLAITKQEIKCTKADSQLMPLINHARNNNNNAKSHSNLKENKMLKWTEVHVINQLAENKNRCYKLVSLFWTDKSYLWTPSLCLSWHVLLLLTKFKGIKIWKLSAEIKIINVKEI